MASPPGHGRRIGWVFAALLVGLVVMACLSLFAGRLGFSVRDTLAALLGRDGPDAATIVPVILHIRVPRILAAIVLGGVLALAGNVYQIAFRNYLVSQDILGVSTGAAVGAAAAIIAGQSAVLIQAGAFVGGLASIAITVGLAAAFRRADQTLSLILAGILTAGFMTSGLGLLKYLADPDTQLQAIVFWTLGGLSSVTLAQLASIAAPVLVCTVVLLLLRWRLTLFAFDDAEALSLGTNIRLLRYVAILAATLLIASVVSVAGTIGWIGLVIPQISRLVCGSDGRHVLPLSLVIGALFLLVIDTASRQFFAADIPIGIFTGFIGTPVFVAALVYRFVRRPA